jgi:hypothetical protein
LNERLLRLDEARRKPDVVPVELNEDVVQRRMDLRSVDEDR